ncbi:MAG: type II toxin-antitoxin system RelE/ParE family toxin [Rickettsiales bacterium]
MHKGLMVFFETGSTAGIQVKHAKRITNILALLNEAKAVQDMNILGYNLHQLKGNTKGLYSVKVSGNWRITFRFENGNAYIVNYLDYH